MDKNYIKNELKGLSNQDLESAIRKNILVELKCIIGNSSKKIDFHSSSLDGIAHDLEVFTQDIIEKYVSNYVKVIDVKRGRKKSLER